MFPGFASLVLFLICSPTLFALLDSSHTRTHSPFYSLTRRCPCCHPPAPRSPPNDRTGPNPPGATAWRRSTASARHTAPSSRSTSAARRRARRAPPSSAQGFPPSGFRKVPSPYVDPPTDVPDFPHHNVSPALPTPADQQGQNRHPLHPILKFSHRFPNALFASGKVWLIWAKMLMTIILNHCASSQKYCPTINPGAAQNLIHSDIMMEERSA